MHKTPLPKIMIDTAILLMQSKDYKNTKLSEVLEASQVGKGQFYYYFSSKQELGMAVVDCFSNTWSRQLLDNLAHGVVALIEGGILLMKSKQDINILINIAHLARNLVYSFSNV